MSEYSVRGVGCSVPDIVSSLAILCGLISFSISFPLFLPSESCLSERGVFVDAVEQGKRGTDMSVDVWTR